MSVKIEYCAPCGYKKHADAAALTLQKQLDVRAELIPGKGGVFRVFVNDEVVIARSGRHFPSPEEIVAAVRDQRVKDHSASYARKKD